MDNDTLKATTPEPIRRIADCAYVINLDHRSDRWARMQDNLQSAGLEAERFAAISIRDLAANPPPQALEDFLLRVDGPGPTFKHKLQATWACMHSHLAVISRARECGKASVLILEDDCEFESYTKVVLRRVAAQLDDQQWDLLYLGGTLKKGSLRKRVSSNLRAVDRVRLAHAYVVSASLYQRILAEAPACGLPLDWYYSEQLLPSVRAFMVDPILAHQRLFDMSDIEQVERKFKLKTRQRFRRWLAKLRYGALFN